MLKHLLTARFKKEQITIIAMVVLMIYSLLVVGLVNAEQAAVTSNINDYLKAIWYSIVVIITTGYGDLYPLTSAGRMISMGFILLSFAFYGFLIIKFIRIFIGR
ncbi:MAG: potassium channel family protein [Bacteroidota bacterium]